MVVVNSQRPYVPCLVGKSGFWSKAYGAQSLLFLKKSHMLFCGETVAPVGVVRPVSNSLSMFLCWCFFASPGSASRKDNVPILSIVLVSFLGH